MESAELKHAGAAGLSGRSPLLRLQSDERLVALTRRGNHGAFEALVARYQSRLLAFCRHMLASKEDAEDVLQEVFAAAFNALLADEREINVRPWLYRIARNRSLNHLRRARPIGVDSMDIHLSEHGLTTADRVHKREDFRLLMGDVQELTESQRTALLLREIDALSYDQIAEAMETTVPSVKSLLVRARVSLAEAAEARLLTCDEVRLELGEVAEGLKRSSPPVRRHLRTCDRCRAFRDELRKTNKALALILPVGPLLTLKKVLLAQFGTSAAAGGGATTAAGTAAGTAAAGTAAGGMISAGASAVATKAAAGLAAAALVTAGAVEVQKVTSASPPGPAATATAAGSVPTPVPVQSEPQPHGPGAPPVEDAAAAKDEAKDEPAAAEADEAARARELAAAEPTTEVTPQTPGPKSQTESDTTTLPGSTLTPTDGQSAPPHSPSPPQPQPQPEPQPAPADPPPPSQPPEQPPPGDAPPSEPGPPVGDPGLPAPTP